MKVSEKELKWLEKELERIVKGDIGEELSDIKIVENLHIDCNSDDDYRRVINFIKNNPNPTRDEIVCLLLTIGEPNNN